MAKGSDDGPPRLIKSVVDDSGLHFFDAPINMSMEDCILRLNTLAGIHIVSLVPSRLGNWLSFELEGHLFSANNPFGEVWFFADDPETPEPILEKIALCIVAPTKPS